MPKTNLTQKFIDNNLACPAGKKSIEFNCLQLPGFYVSVTAISPGIGSFVQSYNDPSGRRRHVKIARTCFISLKEARKRGAEIRADVLLNGSDPQAEIKAKKKSMTWPVLFQDHYLPYKRSHGKKSIKYDIEMNRRITACFADTPLNKLTAVTIRQFHADLKDMGLSPATADLSLKLIRHALNLAVDWDLLKINPALKVKQFNQTRKITRALDAEELARLMRVLTTDKNRMACHFFMLALALGTRRGELLLAEWKHIDRKNKTLFIPSSNAKTAKDRHTFLSDFALHVLDQLGTEGKHTYLFMSSRTGKRLTAVSKAWEKIRVEAQIEDCRIHDLRRTHATMLGEAGVNAMLIKDALGHSSVTTTQIYVSPHDEARHKAANIAGHLLSVAMKSGCN